MYPITGTRTDAPWWNISLNPCRGETMDSRAWSARAFGPLLSGGIAFVEIGQKPWSDYVTWWESFVRDIACHGPIGPIFIYSCLFAFCIFPPKFLSSRVREQPFAAGKQIFKSAAPKTNLKKIFFFFLEIAVEDPSRREQTRSARSRASNYYFFFFSKEKSQKKILEHEKTTFELRCVWSAASRCHGPWGYRNRIDIYFLKYSFQKSKKTKQKRTKWGMEKEKNPSEEATWCLISQQFSNGSF